MPLVDFPVTVQTLAGFFNRDERTIQLWVKEWESKYGLIREVRGEYNFIKCIDCRLKDLVQKIEVLEKSGDERLYAHQIKAQIIKNKKAETDWRISVYQLVSKKNVLLLWSSQINTIKSLSITAENDLKLSIPEEHHTIIADTFRQLRTDIAELTMDDLIDNEEEEFLEDNKDLDNIYKIKTDIPEDDDA